MRNIIELNPRVIRVAEFLGFNLKLMREKKGMSQQDLADKLGVDQSAVSRWENDRVHPPTQVHEGLSKELDLPEDFFQREWQRPMGTYSAEDLAKEWKKMIERMERLEQRFGVEEVLKSHAKPLRPDSPMSRFTSLLADADMVTLYACLYLLSGSKDDLAKVHAVIKTEVVALRQHIRPLRSLSE